MERSIPHVRDIFAPYRSSRETAVPHDRIHVYEHSPGCRRRRHDAMEEDAEDESGPPQDFIDTDHSDSTDETPDHSSSRSANSRQRHGGCHHHLSGRNSSYGDLTLERDRGGSYSSKTLTERDIRHLERHLSMKKTIRKQISRNLAQAFVEDTVVFQGENAVLVPSSASPPPLTIPLPPVTTNNSNFSFTLTRAKMAARAEHTFLDMLKKDGGRVSEADSGHSSPSHQGGFDDEALSMDYQSQQREVQTCAEQQGERRSFSGDQRSSPMRELQPPSSVGDQHKKNSFWKKFVFKGKGKR